MKYFLFLGVAASFLIHSSWKCTNFHLFVTKINSLRLGDIYGTKSMSVNWLIIGLYNGLLPIWYGAIIYFLVTKCDMLCENYSCQIAATFSIGQRVKKMILKLPTTQCCHHLSIKREDFTLFNTSHGHIFSPNAHNKLHFNIIPIKTFSVKTFISFYILMAHCMIAVSPLLMPWKYCSIALSHLIIKTWMK